MDIEPRPQLHAGRVAVRIWRDLLPGEARNPRVDDSRKKRGLSVSRLDDEGLLAVKR